VAKSAAEKAQERLKKLNPGDNNPDGSAVRHGLAKPNSPNKPAIKTRRRQTIDFAIQDHDRLKRIAFDNNIDVGPMLRMLALETTEEEFTNLVSRPKGQ